MPTSEQTARVLIVEDDSTMLASVARILEQEGYAVERYASPMAFLTSADLAAPCCLLLDVVMPELDGIEVQGVLARARCSVPIVFMTGHPDLPQALHALKAGAVDFLLKPFERADLLLAVEAALRRSAEQGARARAVADARKRLARLTPREREVCDLVARGLPNREIASRLGTVESTVKVHRARVMQKLEVDSLPELVRVVDSARSDPA